MTDSGSGPEATGPKGYYIAPRREQGANKRTDALLGIVQEIATEDDFSYASVQSEEQIDNPSSVIQQTLRSIASSAIVFADLTGSDPNVYYEVAIAHALDKPVILLIKHGESAEIDLSGERAISVKIDNNGAVVNAPGLKDRLRRTLRHVRDAKPEDMVTPLQAAGIDMRAARYPRGTGHTGAGFGRADVASPRWASAPDPWIRAAAVGLLDDMRDEDLRPPSWIVHSEHGLGRIERVERDATGEVVFVGMRFASGASIDVIISDADRVMREVYPLRLRISRDS